MKFTRCLIILANFQKSYYSNCTPNYIFRKYFLWWSPFPYFIFAVVIFCGYFYLLQCKIMTQCYQRTHYIFAVDTQAFLLVIKQQFTITITFMHHLFKFPILSLCDLNSDFLYENSSYFRSILLRPMFRKSDYSLIEWSRMPVLGTIFHLKVHKPYFTWVFGGWERMGGGSRISSTLPECF